MEQITFPPFAKIPVWFPMPEENGIKKRIRGIVKINPTTVYHYFAIKEDINGTVTDITFLCATGSNFWVALSFKEFDEYWTNVKRSLDINEPLY